MTAHHTPDCATCGDNGAVGNILDTVPCPDCTAPRTMMEEVLRSHIPEMPRAMPRKTLHDGYEESDRDWVEDNILALRWFIEHHQQIRNALALTQSAVKTLHSMGFAYGGSELWRPPLGRLRPECADWAVVPVEATPQMITAADSVSEDGYDAMLKAMIAVAPKPALLRLVKREGA